MEDYTPVSTPMVVGCKLNKYDIGQTVWMRERALVEVHYS
jgi:hypothetical protein